MAFYETINLVSGDSKPEINLTLRDSNTPASGLTLDPDDPTTWSPIDITDPTVRVKFRALGSSTVLDTLTCVKTDVVNGECYMPWNIDTLDVDPGTYEGEIELTYTSGKVMTVFDKLKFKVRGDF